MTSQPPSSDRPVFDRAHLDRYTGGDAALNAELTGLMCDQARRCLAEMAARPPAAAAWTAAAHTLKGAALGVGAFALADACARAETAAPEARPARRAEIAGLFAKTEAAFGKEGLG